jgi:hypothetical protein
LKKKPIPALGWIGLHADSVKPSLHLQQLEPTTTKNHPHDPPTLIIQENKTSFPNCKEWYTEILSKIEIGTISFIRIEKSPFSK